MGFHAKAEYTLELIKNPRAHERVDQRFVCYGFILSSSTDEYAIEALMENWEEIDKLTSDRIRYLFFIDNVIELTGLYGAGFTRSGYERAHQRMLRLARRNNFSWEVNKEAQVKFDIYGKSKRPWEPQHRIRQLARQLRVDSMMPCLAWVLESQKKHVYVRSIAGLSPAAILREIRRFSDQFYTENVAVFTALDEIETEIRAICGSLDLTLKDLDEVEAMTGQRARLRDCINGLQTLSPDPADRLQLIATLSALAKDLNGLAPLPISSILRGVLPQIPEWNTNISKVQECLDGHSVLKVPHLHSTYMYCITFGSKFPDDIVRLRTGRQRPSPGYVSRFLSAFNEQALAKVDQHLDRGLADRLRSARRYAEGNVEKIESGNVPLSGQLLTYINLLVLMQGLEHVPDTVCTDNVDLLQDLRDDLSAFLRELTHCIALELHLWMYNELTKADLVLDRRIRRRFTSSQLVHEDALKSQHTITELVKLADTTCNSVDCSVLDDYTKIPLPELESTPVRDLLATANDPVGTLDNLGGKLYERLIPIAQVVNGGYTPPAPVGEIIERVISVPTVQVVAKNGSHLQLAHSFVYEGDRSVNKQEVTIKDSEIRESQVVVAELIKGSFNKCQEPSTGKEMKVKLEELTTAVETICKSMAPEDAKDLAQDLDTFVGEAVRKEPRRKWYDLSAEGLKEAAQTVGDLGKPILRLVRDISLLLGF